MSDPGERGSKGFGSSDNGSPSHDVHMKQAQCIAATRFIDDSSKEMPKWMSRANYVTPQFLGFLLRQSFFKFSPDGINMVKNAQSEKRKLIWNSDDDHYLGIYLMFRMASEHTCQKDINTSIVDWIENLNFPSSLVERDVSHLKDRSVPFEIQVDQLQRRLTSVLNDGTHTKFVYSSHFDNPIEFSHEIPHDPLICRPDRISEEVSSSATTLFDGEEGRNDDTHVNTLCSKMSNMLID